jgi:hypothetical protein
MAKCFKKLYAHRYSPGNVVREKTEIFVDLSSKENGSRVGIK